MKIALRHREIILTSSGECEPLRVLSAVALSISVPLKEFSSFIILLVLYPA